MARPIISITKETRELILSVSFLNSCGCPRPDFEDLHLDITRDGCKALPERVIRTDGCAVWVELVEAQPVGVSYPLFEDTCDGDLIFYFDCLMDDLPIGRYVGTLRSGLDKILSFGINLTDNKYTLGKLSSEGYKWKV